MTKKLEEFIGHARSKGMDHSTIRMLLLSAGWKEKEIAHALSAEGLDMQVPTPPDVGGAREAFMHLLSFASLYTLVISFLILCFQFINRAFPDAATDYVYSLDAGFSIMRSSMAAMIVSFPLLIWMTRLIHREIAKNPEKAWSGIRRWLTYVTLFVAATSLMVDVITLIYSLLEGELSIRFLLKVFAVFAVAGAVFMYYFLSLRTDVGNYRPLNRSFFAITASAVAVALIIGLWIVGSPGAQRLKRFDERRLQDLRMIHNEIYAIVYDDSSPREPLKSPTPVNPLPATLQDMLEQAPYNHPNITDPETGEPYGYNVLNARAFELCATFHEPRGERYDIFWNHAAGRHCFEFDTTQRNYY